MYTAECTYTVQCTWNGQRWVQIQPELHLHCSPLIAITAYTEYVMYTCSAHWRCTLHRRVVCQRTLHVNSATIIPSTAYNTQAIYFRHTAFVSSVCPAPVLHIEGCKMLCWHTWYTPGVHRPCNVCARKALMCGWVAEYLTKLARFLQDFCTTMPTWHNDVQRELRNTANFRHRNVLLTIPTNDQASIYICTDGDRRFCVSV